MKFKVIVTPAAEADLAESFAYIHARSPHNAGRWLRALYREIRGLETVAGFGRAPESDYLGVELRQKVFKSHRIIYTLDEKKRLVHVHYVRHGARRPLGEPETGSP
jgi:plasmid stabilization system protein ParE